MADKITNLNLQIPNRDKIIYTSDNRAIGSMTSAQNVDNTNSTYLRNRIEGTNEVKINNKTIKRKLVNKSSDGTDNGSYEGTGRICYGDSGILADITYKTENNTWSKVSSDSDLKSLAPNKYGYNIAHTLVDVDMYKTMYDGDAYNTNSWHLESWSNVTPNSGILTFTRGIKENVIDWTKPVRFYYGNINAEKLYSKNAFSKFNAKLLHIYIGDAKGNYKSSALESFDMNNSKIILHYYNKNNRIMQYEQNITSTDNVWCNMLVIVPEDCYQIEGIEFKLYTGELGNTTYDNEVEATVEISKFNINVWGLEEFVTKYITQELIIQRLKTEEKNEQGEITNTYWNNCDIFNQPLLFNNSMRYDLKLSNSPCPKFNDNTYIEFKNDSLRENEFTSVSFYYKSTVTIPNGSYIIGTNLLSAPANVIDSESNYNTNTDNVIVLTKDSGKYILKVFFQNTKDATDSTKFYDITDYFKTGVGIKFDISKTMLRINDNIVQADNTVHTFTKYTDDSTLVSLQTINDRSVLGSLAKSLTLPGCYYNFKLYTENTSTNSVCLHLPMEEGGGNTVIDVSDTNVNTITDVKYFTIINTPDSWDNQDDIFYNTTEGYYTDIINSDNDVYTRFKDITYFPKINDSVAANFKYVYRPLEHGINCGGIKLSSNEILGIDSNGEGKEVTINNKRLFTKTISTIDLSTSATNANSLSPKYTFNIFNSSSDSAVATENGLWHIHGTIKFGLPQVTITSNEQPRQINISELVTSNYKGKIGSLTLFDYSNKFTDSLTIDQYYYGSFKTGTTFNTLTIEIVLTTLYNGGAFNTANNIAAITAINLTVDKLYFEDNIIASYRYDTDNIGSEYYSGSYYITKYSEYQDTDVKSLYFNNPSSDEIMTYDNTFDTISDNLSTGTISTTVKCNGQIGNSYTISNMLDSNIEFNSIFKDKYNNPNYDINQFTYTTNVESGNNIIKLNGANNAGKLISRTPTITRNNTDAGLNGGTVTFKTTTELDSSVYGFGNNISAATNNWQINYVQIPENVTSNFDLRRGTTSLVGKQTGLINGNYTLSLNLNSNYTFKSVSATNNGSGSISVISSNKLTATCSTNSITSYTNVFAVEYTINKKNLANNVNTTNGNIKNTYNFVAVSSLFYYFKVDTEESNDNIIYEITLTLPNTYGYTFKESSNFAPVKPNSSDNSWNSGTNKTITNSNNVTTINWKVTLGKITNLKIDISLTPNNLLSGITDSLTCTYTYESLSYSNIYYVDSGGGKDTIDNKTNTGTDPDYPAKSLSAVLQYAATYSRLNHGSVTIYLAGSKNYTIKANTDIVLDPNTGINILGVSSFKTKEASNAKIQFETNSTDQKNYAFYFSSVSTTNSNNTLKVNFSNIEFDDLYANENVIKTDTGVATKITLTFDKCIFTNCGSSTDNAIITRSLKLSECVVNNNTSTSSRYMRFYANFFDIQNSYFNFTSGNVPYSIFYIDPGAATTYKSENDNKCIEFNNNYMYIGINSYYTSLFNIKYPENNENKSFTPITSFKYNTIIGETIKDCCFIEIASTLVLDCINANNAIMNSYFKNVALKINGKKFAKIEFYNCAYTDSSMQNNAAYKDSSGNKYNVVNKNGIYLTNQKEGIKYINPNDYTKGYTITLPSQLPGNALPIKDIPDIPDITTDINGKTRSTYNPTIGAVEYYEAGKTLTLKKGLYIDLVNGNDNNSGLSWVSPKKTFKTNLDKVFSDSTFATRYASNGTLNIYVTSGNEELTANVNDNIKDCSYELTITGGYNTTKCESFAFSGPDDGNYTTILGGAKFENNEFSNFKTIRLLHSDEKIKVNKIKFKNFIFTNFCKSETANGNIIYIHNDGTILNALSFDTCKFLNNYNSAAKIYLVAHSGNINKVEFDSCEFTNNISFNHAGVLVFGGPSTNNSSTLIFNKCKFNKCYAGYNYRYSGSDDYDDNAGVYYTTYAPKYITITNCEFNDCKTYDYGGVLYIGDNNTNYSGTDSSEITITNCIFNGNESRLGGGAIYLNSTKPKTITIDRCVFFKNTNTYTSGTGGAIYNNVVNENCTTNIQNSIFYNNTSENVSALYHYVPKNLQFGYCKLNIYHCTFAENYSTNSFAISIDNYYTTNGTTGNVQNNIIWNNIKNGEIINNVQINWTGGLDIFNSLTNADNKNIMNENSLNNGILDLSLSSLGIITEDPKLVPVLYNYNNNIDNNTGLPSLPVCNGSSALNAGKYIGITTDIRGANRATKTNPVGSFTNPTIGACEYLNRSADEFTGICITSDDENDYKVLLDENITINVYYPDLTANAEEALNEIITITDEDID